MRTIKDIEFARAGAGTLRMDLHLPEQTHAGDALPAIVWIHGGGWREGNRLTAPTLPVEHGYAVAAIDYRLTTLAIWPAQLEDCKNAIAFLRQQAQHYNLDPQRIGAWGKSAGGHLVAMLAALSDTVGDGEASWRIAAGCAYCAPSDLELFAQPEWRSRYTVLHDVIVALLGGPIEQRRELARDASPLAFASGRWAPLRIVHGDADDVVPVEQSQSLHRALEQARAHVEIEIIRGLGHHIASVDVDTRTVDFFDRTLKPRAAC